MAVLPANERSAVSADYQRYKSDARESIPITKAQLRAAIDAIDDWLEANAAALNAAIPQPARGALNAQQKLDLILRVLNRRVRGN